ncbi:ATP-dependent exoDNAse (exonuclease V) beta subunit [Natronocella acetinitrilica]|uniref:DNA 3'-5' helicase n=1 Tax=Natronocella acetinitrilica TaxID=414046 RepID=A0AAE3G3N0_9GAMM|nr:UvrD-helicase domain-containing protein [Natronocella acetinitrilica]MCP1674126.1 ATP-dependent exoDNAse (exonuclease V) beta subunit [Natronocella acetinitrilica]
MSIESRLRVVPAGAGSGKTYTIQQTLGAWLESGAVAPDRIIAVTFTEAAAAELRERIRSQLLGAGRLEDALRLEESCITTIHGFGLRVIKEYAFEAGISPLPRLLTNDEADVLIRRSLARTDRAREITDNLSAFGYTYNPGTGKGPEEIFRDHLRTVITRLRYIGARGRDAAVQGDAANWITARYGAAADGEALTGALRAAVSALLAEFPESLESLGNSPTAERELRRDYQGLRRAAEPGVLARDFRLWKGLQSLRKSKRGNPMPEGYDALAEAVEAAAARLGEHPGPLAHALTQCAGLIGASQEALDHYAHDKQQTGLIDYADMIVLANTLLAEREDIREAIRARYDCLIIDEFQDTSPIQFSLLWQLAQVGLPALIVGDIKQAIMGFQGGDARLFDALIKNAGAEVTPLTNNWRSQPRIMDFVNAVGASLFGEDYQALTPKASTSHLGALDVICFSGKLARGVSADVCHARNTAERLKELLDDPDARVVDRKSGVERRLRGSDIAVLCPRHRQLQVYAEVLRAFGIRVRLPQQHWFESRVVQIIDHALAYLAEPGDRHAALYLAVTELGSLTLEEGLAALATSGGVRSPVLERLDAVRERISRDATVEAVVSAAIGALALYRAVLLWPDAEQARANIVRFEGEAFEYRRQAREALSSAGFFGDGVQSFRGWLRTRIESDLASNRQPDARFIDEEAVELTTWHSAKGREWPVVAVCGLANKVEADAPSFDLGYADFSDLSGLLEQAVLEFSPRFEDKGAQARFTEPLQVAREAETARLLYVALTRARDKLVLEWPAYKAGHSGVSLWSLLAERGGIEIADSAVVIGETRCPAHVIDATMDDALPDEAPAPRLKDFGLRAIERFEAPAALTPDAVTPSSVHAAPRRGGVAAVRTARYPMPSEASALEGEGAALGTLLHAAHELIAPRLADPAQARAEAVRIAGEEAADALVRRVEAFERWLREALAPQAIAREIPVIGLTQAGSVVHGKSDLLAETAAGIWVLDHKSDVCEDLAAGHQAHAGQLRAYCEVLERAGHRVLGTGIHWMRYAAVTLSQRDVD